MRGIGLIELPTSFVKLVAVESEAAIEEWIALGIARERIEVVKPGIDVDWFRQAGPPQSTRFTLLFASSPADPAEIASRGIGLLVELARLRPDIDIRIPWRTWGDLNASRLALETLNPPPNFIVEFGDQRDMRRYYAAAHATIVCFSHGAGKTCPNFVLEGLAAGRPAISTSESGIAEDLRRSGAGIVASRDADSLAHAVDVLRNDWATYAAAARALAAKEFALSRFRARYEEFYERLAGSRL
jgi:glycosyltransferase involved in cell wall biosynthesis